MSKAVLVCTLAALTAGCVEPAADSLPILFSPDGEVLVDGPMRVVLQGAGLIEARLDVTQATAIVKRWGAVELDGPNRTLDGLQWAIVVPTDSAWDQTPQPCGGFDGGNMWAPTPEFDPGQFGSLAPGNWTLLAYVRKSGNLTVDIGATPAKIVVVNSTARSFSVEVIQAEPRIESTSPYVASFGEALRSEGPAYFFSTFSFEPFRRVTNFESMSNALEGPALCAENVRGALRPGQMNNTVHRAPLNAVVGEAGGWTWSGHVRVGTNPNVDGTKFRIEGYLLSPVDRVG